MEPQATVAVLAVQGAFIEHERRLEELGARCVELRQARDLEQPFDRLVLPGGESTVQAKLLRELGMLEPLRERIANGMPVLGTCAGLILLAERVEGVAGPCPGFGTLPVTVRRNAYGRQLGSFTAQGAFPGAGAAGDDGRPLPMTFIRAGFGTLPVTVRRNAYGRQLGSFTAQGAFPGAGAAGDDGRPLPMTFIRAPKIKEAGPGVEVLTSVGNGVQRTPAAVRFENQIGCAFHPELDGDPRVHRLFLEL